MAYGPFHRLQGRDLNAQMASTNKACGKPRRNIAQSDIPSVKAFKGHLPDDETGLEFETPVKPGNETPYQASWSEGDQGVLKEGTDLACIPIKILKQVDHV